MTGDAVLPVLAIVFLLLAAPAMVVLAVSVSRGRWVIQAIFRAAKNQVPVADNPFPERYRLLIGSSHILIATLVLGVGVAWVVWAMPGVRDHPWFELGFASLILARVPGLYREGALMTRGRAHRHWMGRFGFLVLGVGNAVTAILFGISAWVGETRLSLILCMVFALWGILYLSGAWSKTLETGPPYRIHDGV